MMSAAAVGASEPTPGTAREVEDRHRCLMHLSFILMLMAAMAPATSAQPQIESRAQCYREIEQFREGMKQHPDFLSSTSPERKAIIVRKWLQLIIDEGAVNPGGMQLFMPSPREIEDLLSKPGREDEAARKLDVVNESWHVDGSAGNIRDHLWKAVEVRSFAAGPSSIALKAVAGDKPVGLTVRVYKNGMVRVTADKPGFFNDATLAPDAIAAADKGNAIEVTSSWGTLSISKQPYALRVTVRGQTVWDEKGVQFLYRDGALCGVRHSAGLVGGDHFYGFGSRHRQLDYRGSVVTHWHSPATPSINRGHFSETYAPIAFMVNPRGIGLFWNSSYRGQFDLGASEPDLFKAAFFGPVFDYYLFCDPSPLTIIGRYTDITGKPLVPPEWAFKTQMGGVGHRWTEGGKKSPVDVVSGEIRKAVEHNIPHGSIFVEAFDSRQNMERILPLLNASGIRWMAWDCPAWGNPVAWGKSKGLDASEARKMGLLLGDGSEFAIPKGRFLAGKPLSDFTHPRIAEMYEDLARDRISKGFRGGMLDDGDDVPPDALFFDGRRGDEMHGQYAYYYLKTYHDVWSRLTNGDCLHFARPSTAGAQRFVCQFLGDLKQGYAGIRENIYAGLSFSASGIPNWGGCIGGYFTRPTKEEYIRWTQLGCFNPIMRYHGGQPREPWYYDEETIAIYKFHAWLRVNLLPYILAFVRETHATGIPGVMALPLVFPDDANTCAVDDEFMFGPGLLIAPVTAEARSRPVYLPAGRWHPFWTDDPPLAGGGKTVVDAPLREIPVFAPDGAIIPLRLDRSWKIGEAIVKEETVYRIFPPREGASRFQDGGVSVQCLREKGQTRVNVIGVTGTAGLWVKACASSVTAKGIPLKPLADRAAFAQSEAGFCTAGRAVFIRHAFTGNDEILIGE
jgi:alpha-glucosidase (family GH31 glycosyl hydrolase)